MVRPLLLTGLVLLAGTGCADSQGPNEAIGTLVVYTHTTGDNPDADGFTLTVSSQGTQAMGLVDTATYAGLPIGDYSVTLGDVEGSCTVADGNPRTPYVAMGMNTMHFYVTCP